MNNLHSLLSKSAARIFCAIIWSAAAFILPATALGITLGQVDNFEDGTTQGWGDPAANSINIATGGPTGLDDNYVQVSSGTFGGGQRLITFNQSQWIGNYVSAGVTGITMDLRNFGTSTLSMRIAIREGTGGSFTPGYSSTVAFNLPADGLWHTAFFSLSAGSMTPINSPQPLATDLANVQDFRLLSSAAPATIGDFMSGQFGVDNITTSPVPEPASMVLAGLALVGVWRFRKIATLD